MTDWNSLLESLEKIDDETMKSEILQHGISISDDKFRLAFSTYGAIQLFRSNDQVWRDSARGLPPGVIKTIRFESTLLLSLYVVFLFMREGTLERGLEIIPVDSPLRPFVDFFRTPKKKENQPTLSQHIRNALGHGGVTFLGDGNVRIVDFDARNQIETANFLVPETVLFRLCKQVKRFFDVVYRPV